MTLPIVEYLDVPETVLCRFVTARIVPRYTISHLSVPKKLLAQALSQQSPSCTPKPPDRRLFGGGTLTVETVPRTRLESSDSPALPGRDLFTGLQGLSRLYMAKVPHVADRRSLFQRPRVRLTSNHTP